MENKEEYYRQYNKARYQKRKENGICFRCGGKLDREGAFCERCREEVRKEAKALRKKRYNKGMCICCGKNKAKGDGIMTCPECLEKANQRGKMRYIHKKAGDANG